MINGKGPHPSLQNLARAGQVSKASRLARVAKENHRAKESRQEKEVNSNDRDVNTSFLSRTAMSAPSVPLHSKADSTTRKNQPPVWPIEISEATDTPEVPLPAKCSRNDHPRDGVCCKELIGDDERQLIDPDVVRDVCVNRNISSRRFIDPQVQRYWTLRRTYGPVRIDGRTFLARGIKTRGTRRRSGTYCRSYLDGYRRILGFSG